MPFATPLSPASMHFLLDEAGASLAEYALIGSLALVVFLLLVLALSNDA